MQQGAGAGAGAGAGGVGPPGSSTPASPANSSDSLHHHQQWQQLALQQSLQQQQQLIRPEGDEAVLMFHSGGGIHGNLGSRSNFPSSSCATGDGQSIGRVVDQQLDNPTHQAYLQFASQNAQQQGRFNTANAPGRGDQDMQINNIRIHELMSLQAAHQTQGVRMEQGRIGSDQRSELNPPQAANMMRPQQSVQSQARTENIGNNQMLMSQLQAMQAWALERNIDLSLPQNAKLIPQLLPIWQSAMQELNETSTSGQGLCLPSSKQQVLSSFVVAGETFSRGNSLSNLSGQVGIVKGRQILPSGAVSSDGPVNSSNIQMQQQLASQSMEYQNEGFGRTLTAVTNNNVAIHPPQTCGSSSQNVDHSKGTFTGAAELHMKQRKQMHQLNHPTSQAAGSSTEILCPQVPSQDGPAHVPQQCTGFTKQQFHVLKAQILAFRRLKRGEGLPLEVLQAIAPPPLDSKVSQAQQVFRPEGMTKQEKSVAKNVEEHTRHLETNDKVSLPARANEVQVSPKDEAYTREKRTSRTASAVKLEENSTVSVKPEQETGQNSQVISFKRDNNVVTGKSTMMDDAMVDAGKKPFQTSGTPVSKDAFVPRKYQGPLFDSPFFTRRHESSGSTTGNYSNSLKFSYDLKDLLFEEGMDMLNKKKTENLEKISDLLAVNLDRKRIRPDLVLKLEIEKKKLRLLDLQAHLRGEVDQEQQEIMSMSDRPYRTFVKQCERQRVELFRHVQQSQKALREKQIKSVFQWRKKFLEAHWAIRDSRTTRNRGVAKYHERMLREFSKRKDDDRNKRMEALKNNDVDRYREMLLEQQTHISGDAAQRYSVLSSFLSQTEEYLYKLGGKITAAKNHQEVEEAAKTAAAAARCQGLSEEEVRAAAACAREEVMIRKRFSEMNAPKESASVNKYYSLAHAVNERVVRQPSMLRAGMLRDYQLVGLQWMLSLYNNKLNGILADEMGLGKTVQVMALIAYLMEFKGNYGPHLIIVPNAVLVNWKSELHNWLPSVRCIFYVGEKDRRSNLLSREVRAMKFNVLVTTYEFVMYDRSKLSKISWKYIIIDEAQRMKDRESVLARDLDKYCCQRRLLLTGTPLQNDLKELWSLLNLLLPEVFDNRKAFHDWFSKPFQKDGPSQSVDDDDWLETEKKVIIIHRLHQILEPFMLRRRVEDVEGSLPRKVSIVLRCRMSAIQGSIYDWIKSTGTIRVDPEDGLRRVKKNPMYQARVYKNLNNKCMELRKACNHPLLNYPYFSDYSKDFIVRSCGKLWILDRVLIKLQRSGHRVLLFSTMTKLLDILEEYLQWRRLIYRRIDGATSLEDRESAIVDFNRPSSDCFIFLLSIRAAGRGLNLQSADTVIIYDPDPNPQNEEQAVARAYRIGQKREVKVIYMEAVVDRIPSYQKEDDPRNGDKGDLEDDLAGKDRYMGSIESLIRNNIQQYKLDMADEVINAGRFDQRTSHEERRMTLETLLHDEERNQGTLHDVPSLHDVNQMIARSEEEVELFDQMDEEFDWTMEMIKHNQVPEWLRAGSRELNAAVASLTKKPSKDILIGSVDPGSSELLSGFSDSKTERRGRSKGRSAKNYAIYRELDDANSEDSDSSSKNIAYSLQSEERDREDLENKEFNDNIDARPSREDQSDEEGMTSDGGAYESSHVMKGIITSRNFIEPGSSGSYLEGQKLYQLATPSISLQKFGSLSALDARPKRKRDELEGGEIAVSGDSHMDIKQSRSWNHDRDYGEDEQVLQPKIRRKRSLRVRSRSTVDRVEDKSSSGRVFSPLGSQLPLRLESEHDMQLRKDPKKEAFSEPISDRHRRHDTHFSLLKQSHSAPSRKTSHVSPQKSDRLNFFSGSAEDAFGNSRESLNSKSMSMGDLSLRSANMSDSLQRKCKNVIFKLLRRIENDGCQIAPILYDLWKRKTKSSFAKTADAPSDLFDIRRIDHRVDNFEYNCMMDFLEDMQLMLRNAAKHCGYSAQVRLEAGKLHDLFIDFMKITFPDVDFREARNMFTLRSPKGVAIAPCLKQVFSTSAGHSKWQSTIREADPDLGAAKSGLDGSFPSDEYKRIQRHATKSHREARQEQTPLECLLPPSYPGNLVICKKRRKDRDKPATPKQRVGPASPPLNQARIDHLSPSSSDQVALTSLPEVSRSSRFTGNRKRRSGHQATPPQPMRQGSGESAAALEVEAAQWNKPVKRSRTVPRKKPSVSK